MRKAISLIELVFAIVIIGIAAMSFPLILTQTSSNIKMALQQEAILNAKAYIGIILSHPWDKNSVSSMDAHGGRVMVLGTANRPGHLAGFNRRAMMNPFTIAANSNIGGFHNVVENLAVANANDLDYILNFSLTPTISFVNDTTNYGNANINFNFNIAPAAGTTDIKMIDMRAFSATDDIDIVLRAYSSNVGDYILAKRDF